MNIYTFSPFGYEGTLVQVEVDLRRGIPAVDIIGLADGAVAETRERIRYAFSNSGIEFPAERVLMSLSPADLRKDAPMDLAMALGIANAQGLLTYPTDSLLVLGELDLSGNVRPVRGVHAALATALSTGIKYAVIPEDSEMIEGVKCVKAKSLKDAIEKINNDDFWTFESGHSPSTYVSFNDDVPYNEIKGNYEAKLATMLAAAGKHNILYIGAPGCGKTMLSQSLAALTPDLTDEESKPTTRVWSLAGLTSGRLEHLKHIPFRMPHQTATIEGICGGGPNCRPGEISLAHNGILFLDEAAEFRTSVLQMLRVPLECKSITLSRAGRSTSYPANFQLVMATSPCPCGNFGVSDRICLCSSRSVEMYWKKFSDPLLDRIALKVIVENNSNDEKNLTFEEMREKIRTAIEIQRTREVYNNDITPQQFTVLFNPDKEAMEFFDRECEKLNLTARQRMHAGRLAITVANCDGRTDVQKSDIKTAFRFVKNPLEV